MLRVVRKGGKLFSGKLSNWCTERVCKSERGKEKVCKCLLKLNSDVCAVLLKYSKELLPHKSSLNAFLKIVELQLLQLKVLTTCTLSSDDHVTP